MVCLMTMLVHFIVLIRVMLILLVMDIDGLIISVESTFIAYSMTHSDRYLRREERGLD